MSQSIFDKLRVITLASLHLVLDKAKDQLGPEELAQYLRDVEKARNQLDDQAAAERSTLSSVQDRIAALEARNAEADGEIDALLSDDDPSNDKFATPLQIEIDSNTKLIEDLKAGMATTQALVDKYADAVGRMDNILTVKKGELERLRQLSQNAAAQSRAAKALEGVQIGDAPDTAGVENRLRQQAAVAGNQLDRALDGVAGSAGPTAAEASAAAKIAARRAKIAAGKSEGQ